MIVFAFLAGVAVATVFYGLVLPWWENRQFDKLVSPWQQLDRPNDREQALWELQNQRLDGLASVMQISRHLRIVPPEDDAA